MRGNCKFQMNQTLLCGILMNCSALLLKNTLEPTGGLLHLLCFAEGAAVALMGVGLLYGCPKTRPLFDKFHALKRRRERRAEVVAPYKGDVVQGGTTRPAVQGDSSVGGAS